MKKSSNCVLKNAVLSKDISEFTHQQKIVVNSNMKLTRETLIMECQWHSMFHFYFLICYEK